MRLSILSLIAICAIFCGCKTKPVAFEGAQPQNDIIATANAPRIVKAASATKQDSGMPQTPDTTFVDLKNYSTRFIYDIKYATNDNFLNRKVYDCPECYLRLKTVEALIAANAEFETLGYKIKIFDCYRPLDIQKKMWEIVANPDYVANPKTGSVHNRGGAVDITLVDASGNELDMGTRFDHFGPEAAIAYQNLNGNAKNNRKLLQRVMSQHGFTVLKSEWWHFNYEGAAKEKISNFKWGCR